MIGCSGGNRYYIIIVIAVMGICNFKYCTRAHLPSPQPKIESQIWNNTYNIICRCDYSGGTSAVAYNCKKCICWEQYCTVKFPYKKLRFNNNFCLTKSFWEPNHKLEPYYFIEFDLTKFTITWMFVVVHEYGCIVVPILLFFLNNFFNRQFDF